MRHKTLLILVTLKWEERMARPVFFTITTACDECGWTIERACGGTTDITDMLRELCSELRSHDENEHRM